MAFLFFFYSLESFGFKGATVTKVYFGISESGKKRGDPPFVMSRRAGTLIALRGQQPSVLVPLRLPRLCPLPNKNNSLAIESLSHPFSSA